MRNYSRNECPKADMKRWMTRTSATFPVFIKEVFFLIMSKINFRTFKLISEFLLEG